LALVDRFTPAELLRITQVLQETAAGFVKSANRRVDAELCILRLCDPGLDLDARSLNARISKLEDQLASGQFVQAAVHMATEQEDDDRPPLFDDEDAPPVFEEAPPVPPMVKPEEMPTGFLADFFARLTPELPPSVRGFLNPNGAVKVRVEQNMLLLQVPGPLEKSRVDTPKVLEPAARVASALLGRPLRARCVEQNKRNLDNDASFQKLLDFGQTHEDIVKITNNK